MALIVLSGTVAKDVRGALKLSFCAVVLIMYSGFRLWVLKKTPYRRIASPFIRVHVAAVRLTTGNVSLD